METAEFDCVVVSTDNSIPLGLEIWLDDHKFFDQDHISESHSIKHKINDAEGNHQLRFVLKNKLPEHTSVDSQNNILSDATIKINGIRFDDIDCDYLVSTLAEYKHDFNGTSEPTTQSFYGELGCNGTVTLKFTTPIYLWLLEKM
jgi:hypothetical protein